VTSPLLDAHEAAGASVVEVGPDRFVARFRDLTDELADARGGGARFDRSFRPRLRVSGDDHRDFLHRMSTAANTPPSAGSGTPTLFLERTGRLVDRLAALSFEDGMLLVGNQGRGAFARDWIERYVITELVDVLDVTAETFLITVLGTRAPEVLRTAFDVDVTDWVPWTHAPVELHDGQIARRPRRSARRSRDGRPAAVSWETRARPSTHRAARARCRSRATPSPPPHRNHP
jgi:glycine cleavage system aminomethyltransferase T